MSINGGINIGYISRAEVLSGYFLCGSAQFIWKIKVTKS